MEEGTGSNLLALPNNVASFVLGASGAAMLGSDGAAGAAGRASPGRVGAPGGAALPGGCGVLAAAASPARDSRSRRADAVGRWRSELSGSGVPGRSAVLQVAPLHGGQW